jgi:hypothetical protein
MKARFITLCITALAIASFFAPIAEAGRGWP